ncbi:hypothetical protein [Saccharopolyspora terrae]|nr:hypothetical protein [Saccharopolyspora terrae]
MESHQRFDELTEAGPTTIETYAMVVDGIALRLHDGDRTAVINGGSIFH